jgi:type IV pilus assembly protein PilX
MNPLFLSSRPSPARGDESGISLVIVMMILVIVSLLGVSAAQIALMGERGARNDRDTQLAWQSAEAALVDAEFDIRGTATTPARSVTTFGMGSGSQVDPNLFLTDCGGPGSQQGLCNALLAAPTTKPAWLTVDFTTTGSSAKSVALGTFTGRTFASGVTGAQPAKAPRYVVEALQDPIGRDRSSPVIQYVYRVTAMGFGPRADIQSVVQMIYRN